MIGRQGDGQHYVAVTSSASLELFLTARLQVNSPPRASLVRAIPEWRASSSTRRLCGGTALDKELWDLFISHASEDKETFVRPLALALDRLGVSVWYDEFTLRLGDSLSRSIDHGLANSVYGLVIISSSFLTKPWPEYELRGLVAREIDEDRVILPVWHGVTREQVLNFSPPLADKVALNTEGLSGEDLALQILRVVRPELYNLHPRAELERLSRGEGIIELQREFEHARAQLQEAREQLAEFKCPYCEAPLADRFGAPADDNHDHWGLRESFECGYQAFDGVVEVPCPSDPRFPAFEDYELQFYQTGDQEEVTWWCYARPKTDWARRVPLYDRSGETQEEAAARVREDYDHRAKRAG